MDKLIITFCALATVFPIAGGAAEYQVDRESQNSVMFISDAPLEDFEGVTDRIDGYVRWEGEAFPPDQTKMAASDLYFEVELAALDTGIGLRNRHMRENYLETEKYPYAEFTAHLTEAHKISDTLYSATAVGKFKIHGEEREITIPTTMISKGGKVRVLSDFEVKLPDYKIKVPKLMYMKINEVIKLKLDFYLKPAVGSNQ